MHNSAISGQCSMVSACRDRNPFRNRWDSGHFYKKAFEIGESKLWKNRTILLFKVGYIGCCYLSRLNGFEAELENRIKVGIDGI